MQWLGAAPCFSFYQVSSFSVNLLCHMMFEPGASKFRYTLAKQGWFGDPQDGLRSLFREAHADFKAWKSMRRISSSQRLFKYGLETCSKHDDCFCFAIPMFESMITHSIPQCSVLAPGHEKSGWRSSGSKHDLQSLEWACGFGVVGFYL